MRKRASQPARPARLHGPANNRPAPPARSSRPAHELAQAQQPSDQQPTTKQPVLQAPWRLCVFFSSLLMIFLSMFSSFTNSLGHKYLQFFYIFSQIKKINFLRSEMYNYFRTDGEYAWMHAVWFSPIIPCKSKCVSPPRPQVPLLTRRKKKWWYKKGRF